MCYRPFFVILAIASPDCHGDNAGSYFAQPPGCLMKTELRLRASGDQSIVEQWHGEKLIGTVCGASGPGIRVIAEQRIRTTLLPADGTGVSVLEVEMVSAQDPGEPLAPIAETKSKSKRKKSA
jgi:hypothetical protein